MDNDGTDERSRYQPRNKWIAFRIGVVGEESLSSGHYERGIQERDIRSIINRDWSAVADFHPGWRRKPETIAGLISKEIVAGVAGRSCVSKRTIWIENDGAVG